MQIITGHHNSLHPTWQVHDVECRPPRAKVLLSQPRLAVLPDAQRTVGSRLSGPRGSGSCARMQVQGPDVPHEPQQRVVGPHGHEPITSATLSKLQPRHSRRPTGSKPTFGKSMCTVNCFPVFNALRHALPCVSSVTRSPVYGLCFG